MEYHAPITVLITFLNQAKEYKSDRYNFISVKSVFCSVLEIEEQELYTYLSELLNLITQIKEQINKNFKNKDRYLLQLEEVQKALLNVSLSEDISKFQLYVTDVLINTLELCADGLEEKEEFFTISTVKLNDIQNQILILSEQLESSELPKNLVFHLLTKLEEIELAIRRYKRWGINDFEKTYDSLLGGLYKKRNEIDEEKNKSILHKIDVFMKSLLGITNSSSEIVNKAIDLHENVTDFLEK